MVRFVVLHCLALLVKLALFSAIPTIPLYKAKPCITHGGDTTLLEVYTAVAFLMGLAEVCTAVGT